MSIVEVIRVLLLIYAGWWASYVLTLPIVAALRGNKPQRESFAQASLPEIAVIVPAHDMKKVIERCVCAL